MLFGKNNVLREKIHGFTRWQPFSAFSELNSLGLALCGIPRQ